MCIRDSPHSIWMEALKSTVGLAIIYLTGDWFLINDWLAGGVFFVIAYLIVSALVVAYFVIYEIGWKGEVPTIKKVRG